MSEPAPRSGPGKWRALIQRLESMGFRPSRTRGQNFLFDDALLDLIAAEAQLDRECAVLEVGPGCGVLTERLGPLSAEVLAVELDPQLAELTRERTEACGNVEVVCADALSGKHALAPQIVEWTRSKPRWRLVANLPYSVGTPVLVACSRLEHPPEAMFVLLQLELVERIAASPGSKSWGAVSAKLQLAYDVRQVRRVGPHVFWPRPSVDSALARLTRRAPFPTQRQAAQFDALANHLFAQRRKTVRSRLAALPGGRPKAEAVCAELGLGDARPEQLSVDQLLALGDTLERVGLTPPLGANGAVD